MFGRNSTDVDPLAQRRRIRRFLAGLIGAACIALWAALWLDYPLIGIGLYWLGILTFAIIHHRAHGVVQDERDLELERLASMSTIQVTAIALLIGAPGMVALDTADVYTAPPQLAGAMYAYAILFGVFGVAHHLHKRRR